MKLKLKISLVLCLAVGGSFIQVSVLRAQTYPPTNWVNNPFNPNPNFGIVQGHTAHPAFTNNAVNRGTLYLNSPIGASLTLANPGDAITFRGQVALTGDLNPDGNLQFRFGLLYQGSNPADTNWLGYVVGNPTGVGGDANSGLYVRNNPNPGIYTSGSPGNAMRPICEAHAYTAGWAPGGLRVRADGQPVAGQGSSCFMATHRDCAQPVPVHRHVHQCFSPDRTARLRSSGIYGGSGHVQIRFAGQHAALHQSNRDLKQSWRREVKIVFLTTEKIIGGSPGHPVWLWSSKERRKSI